MICCDSALFILRSSVFEFEFEFSDNFALVDFKLCSALIFIIGCQAIGPSRGVENTKSCLRGLFTNPSPLEELLGDVSGDQE